MFVSIIITTLCTDDDNSFSERPECLQLYDENVLNKDVVYIINRINIYIEQIEMFCMPCDESFNDKDDYYMSWMPISKIILKYFVDLKVTLKFICSR